MKQLRERLVRFIYRYVLPYILWAVYRALSFTWRITIIEPPALQASLAQKHPVILAHWHGDEILLISFISRYRIATLASTSIDGDMMSRLIELLGGATSRGSSTRGGASALRGLIRLVRGGRNSSMAVDGPKGPLHQVKPGVFELSRLLRAQIYAGGVSCDRAWRFPRSWNKTYFPKPFAKITVVWEGPFGPVASDQDSRDAGLALQLKNALHYSSEVADKKNFAARS